jgi:hypothetical protein
MPDVRLSVLVAGLLKRVEEFGLPLYRELSRQARGRGDVEILAMLDDQKMSTGLKRRALASAARGQFFSFVDDDDWVASDYVESIVAAIEANPSVDVITYDVDFWEDGRPVFVRRFWIAGPWPAGPIEGMPGDVPTGVNMTGDKPSHTMCWRKDLVKDLEFTDAFHGEDVTWVVPARERLKTETNLCRVLYHYRSRTSNIEHAIMQGRMRGVIAPSPGMRKDGRPHKVSQAPAPPLVTPTQGVIPPWPPDEFP